jgi:hypothetical protein
MSDDELHDSGRSRERERQDKMLERTEREEGWLKRLWRSRLAKGRPKPSTERPGEGNEEGRP